MQILVFKWIALAFFTGVFASEDITTTSTSRTSLQKIEAAKAKVQQVLEEEREAKKIRTQIQTITQCRSFDIEGDGCRNPIAAFPANPRHIEYDWESRYTVTWDKVDDDYKQIFSWKTVYCGSVNKTIETGQRSFTFYFKDLAKEFVPEECNFTIKQIQMMANSQANSLRVEQPDKPGQGRIRVAVGPFPILDELTISTMYWRVREEEPYRYPRFPLSSGPQRKPLCERGMNVYTVGLSLGTVAVTSFIAGRYFSTRPGQITLQ